MGKDATVIVDAAGYKPYADSKDFQERRITEVARYGGKLEDLPEKEFDRLMKAGAIVEFKEGQELPHRDVAAAGVIALSRGETVDEVFARHDSERGVGGVHRRSTPPGPPLPGQTDFQIADLAANVEYRPAPAAVAVEAYPLMSSAHEESADQQKAREQSDDAGRKAAAHVEKKAAQGKTAGQTDTAENKQ